MEPFSPTKSAGAKTSSTVKDVMEDWLERAKDFGDAQGWELENEMIQDPRVDE